MVDRSSGRLTEEGEVALTRARRVMAELEALTSDVAALRNEVVGHVRLGVIGSISRWLVPTLLAEARAQYPEVTLVVVNATTTSLLPQLLDGSLDLALVNLPVSDPRLIVEPLFAEERVLVVPAEHPLARRDAVRLGELAGEGLVLEPKGTAFRDELDQAAAALGVELTPLAEVDGMTLVASLAFRSYGPAVLPTSATLHEPPGAWVSRRIDDLRPRSVGLARRRAGRLSAPAKAVAELVRHQVDEIASQLDGVVLASE